MMWWNGEPMPVPAAPIQYTYRDIEGTNSGQTLGGSYSKKVIARKEDLLVTWQSLSAEEAQIVAKIRNSIYGRLTYYSPEKGCFITNTVYTDMHSHNMTGAVMLNGTIIGDFDVTIQFKQR